MAACASVSYCDATKINNVTTRGKITETIEISWTYLPCAQVKGVPLQLLFARHTRVVSPALGMKPGRQETVALSPGEVPVKVTFAPVEAVRAGHFT